MNVLIQIPARFKHSFRYKTVSETKFCAEIIEYCEDFITFYDNSGNLQRIDPVYVSFWGRDIYAEILADYYNSAGLNVNTPRRMEYYTEAKEVIEDYDYIRFCNDNVQRWSNVKRET